MSAIAEKLTVQEFRRKYAETKPSCELLNGEAIQKAWPTKLHSVLQFVLTMLLKELGYKPLPELTLAIDASWEPTPDVCGIIGPEQDPYPTHAVAVAIEILSPDDRFTRVIQKCRKYAAWAWETFWFSIRSAGKHGAGTRLPATSPLSKIAMCFAPGR